MFYREFYEVVIWRSETRKANIEKDIRKDNWPLQREAGTSGPICSHHSEIYWLSSLWFIWLCCSNNGCKTSSTSSLNHIDYEYVLPIPSSRNTVWSIETSVTRICRDINVSMTLSAVGQKRTSSRISCFMKKIKSYQSYKMSTRGQVLPWIPSPTTQRKPTNVRHSIMSCWPFWSQKRRFHLQKEDGKWWRRMERMVERIAGNNSQSPSVNHLL